MKATSILMAILFILSVPLVSAQKIETVDGVRVVHNEKGGTWGKNPEVKLTLVRTLGDVDTMDENLAFYMPSRVALDGAGNIYIVDTGNHRIQKFDPDGKYLATIGRQGQGPGEFYYPSWLDIDAEGNLYVSDPHNNRIQILTPEGKELKTVKFIDGLVGNAYLTTSGNLIMGPPVMRFRFGGEGDEPQEPPKLVKELDLEGKVRKEFGESRDFNDELLNTMANEVIVTVDDAGQIYLAFPAQNRIEKLAADGRVLWRADRKLNYSMEIKGKGEINREGGNVSVRMPDLNRCASAIAVDGKGRLWVVTLDRQLNEDERVGRQVSISQSTGGGRSIGFKTVGNTELEKTDAYKLEIYDTDGVLLGEIPLEMFVDGITIAGDRLFLMDALRGTKFYEFKIEE